MHGVDLFREICVAFDGGSVGFGGWLLTFAAPDDSKRSPRSGKVHARRGKLHY